MKDSYIKNINGLGPVLFERSKRARRIIIYIRPSKGIRVAVPKGASFKKAEEFVFSKKAWINKQSESIKQYEKDRKNIRDNFSGIDKAVAKKALTGRLQQLAERYGFTYNKVSIRSQRTRWGSCSHKNNISLNVRLVRLPRELMDYVILHELVHTRIHNHGMKFWKELDRYTGNGKEMARRLRTNDLKIL